jgi:hypothetical protein
MPPGGGGGMPPGGGGGMPPGIGGGLPPGIGIGREASRQAQQNNTNTPPTLTGNFVGRIANATLLAGPTSPFGLNLGTSQSFQTATASGGIFTASLGSSSTFSAPLTGPGTRTGITAFTQPFGSSTFSGTSVLFPDSQYFLYELNNQSNNQKILAFAGVPTATLPISGATFYAARDDFILGSKVFGIPAADGGNLSISSTGSDAAIYWDNSLSATAQRAFTAFSGGVSGTGSSQKMAFSIFVGQVNTSASATVLEGNFVGTSSLNNGKGQFFEGIFKTSCNCNGSMSAGIEYGFYGTRADHFILTSGQLSGSSQISPFERRQGIEPLQTYNPAINFNSTSTTGSLSPEIRNAHLSSTTTTSFNRELTGWVHGLGVSVDKSNGVLTPFTFKNNSTNLNHAKIQTDPNTNKVAATFNMKKARGGSDLLFVTLGDKDPSFGTSPTTYGSSAFIDDKEFASTVGCTSATCGSTVTFNGGTAANGAFGMATLDKVPGLDGTYADCSYCTWGLIAGEIETNSPANTFERMTGFWTAGAVQDLAQIPASGSASYEGHMIATVTHNGALYIEHGDAKFTVNFAASASSGTLTVTNFDGGGLTGNFSGISSESPGHSFSGSLSGTGALSGVSGGHSSSFYTDSAGNAVAGLGGEIYGNGTVAGTDYIFGGVHVQTCSGGACQ